ncbi:uncharacterized protein Z520_08289 [Fonsecaea multimorphosa CBS 102226]|uniref:YbhB/YbcL family Raf kinase inhibitor-like protein n=1 Tax=Fonsecaea multimorphosa CBS 102226 TaxID=1442371 RepID=A0A0D2JZK9_9EURO|nr:uncharacterized protein Z520_08289 [Fonsecaea multimorphosa CBS 102226]KIX96034.1 hypothetical protein Z520_08289 [Fonsecaea multimorphosa CBS 102226]OAL21802.1 hypothetical protein AYO22_07744 [Fonsecaea multimorphosa]
MPDHPILKSVLSLIEDNDAKTLRVSFSSRKVKPGDKIPKREAQEVPTLGWNAASGQKFLVVCLDIDAPFPTFAPLSPVLHWLQTGLAAEGSTSGGDLTSPDPAIAHWAAPGPPPLSSPHRYIFLLYDQPADFDTRTLAKAGGFGIRERMRWDLSRFEQQAKLGPAVAATYFLSN